MIMMVEEEEKVPNEHPGVMKKTPPIGLGYYQSNYFSQQSHE
jgi:hypothetical protein